MNKQELIDYVAEQADIPKTAASRALNAITEGITSALKNGEEVSIINFGKFLVRHREARKGRNPRTGEAIMIKAAKVPSFQAGKELKSAVQAEEA